eukprot:CAMPEP_0114151332 /NCGR_PEP_ID=MMETSP0043_2-20121206/23194_1 /TAXON_ID=464988 /ORGANISM="Hemiselmis andersenii, Strain CCMP644" /LENGTH=52 /DNA_ID=CAMNT_0001246151 /DNA_START=194 /DNA_END=348 /DNA_ORIENTATION=-
MCVLFPTEVPEPEPPAGPTSILVPTEDPDVELAPASMSITTSPVLWAGAKTV